MKASTFLLALVLASAPLGAAIAQTAMTDDAKMTLYTYDKDSAGMSSCYDQCATNWPPYLAKEGETKGEGWSMIDRTDGTKQWAYEGKPVYLYKEDMKEGDMMGEGKADGAWHTLTQ